MVKARSFHSLPFGLFDSHILLIFSVLLEHLVHHMRVDFGRYGYISVSHKFLRNIQRYACSLTVCAGCVPQADTAQNQAQVYFFRSFQISFHNFYRIFSRLAPPYFISCGLPKCKTAKQKIGH